MALLVISEVPGWLSFVELLAQWSPIGGLEIVNITWHAPLRQICDAIGISEEGTALF